MKKFGLFLMLFCVVSSQLKAQTNYWQANGSKIYYSAGNVGIGTNNPQTALEVNGSIYMPAGQSYRIGSINESGNRLRLHHNGSNAYIDFLPNLYFRAVGSANTIFFSQNGNVGIGGDQPQYPLDILNTTPNSTKAVVRLGEGALAIKAYNSQPVNCKMFAIEHRIYDTSINSAINFWRGGSQVGGWITFDVYDGRQIAKLNHGGMEVFGAIRAKEVIVAGTWAWPDYVFTDDYQLPPLNEVKINTSAKTSACRAYPPKRR
jgi:hypothetical protein